MQSSYGEDLEIGDKIAGRYEILSVLGKGSMGVVYKTRDERLGRVVAIKTLRVQRILDDRSAKRFEREARASSMLEHGNLIAVHDFGYTPEGVPYLVMDYVSGVPLYNIIKSERCLTPDRMVFIYTQVCDGLYHAHQRGVIHRDLKPANMIIVKRDHEPESVRIVDLGVAKIVHASEDETEAITRTGEVCGSPIYLSPEQCMYRELDPRTDIYSLGVCMYESLTGVAPLRGATVYDTIYMHVHEMPRPFNMVAPDLQIPKRLEEVVMRCLAKHPDERYETMLQLKHELMNSLRQPEPNSPQAAPPVHVMAPEEFFQDRMGKSEPQVAAIPQPAPAAEKTPARSSGKSAASSKKKSAKPVHQEDTNDGSGTGRRSLRSTLWETLNRPVLTKEKGSLLQIIVAAGIGAAAVHVMHLSSDKPALPPMVVISQAAPGGTAAQAPSGGFDTIAPLPTQSGTPAKQGGKAGGKSGKKQPQNANQFAFAQMPQVKPHSQTPKKLNPAMLDDPVFSGGSSGNTQLQQNYMAPIQMQSPPHANNPRSAAMLNQLTSKMTALKNNPKAQALLQMMQQTAGGGQPQTPMPPMPQQPQGQNPFFPAAQQTPLQQTEPPPAFSGGGDGASGYETQESIVNKLNAAQAKGDWAAAADCYQKLYREDPGNSAYKTGLSKALYNRAEQLRRQGQNQQALEAIDKAVALSPSNEKFLRLQTYLRGQ